MDLNFNLKIYRIMSSVLNKRIKMKELFYFRLFLNDFNFIHLVEEEMSLIFDGGSTVIFVLSLINLVKDFYRSKSYSLFLMFILTLGMIIFYLFIMIGPKKLSYSMRFKAFIFSIVFVFIDLMF